MSYFKIGSTINLQYNVENKELLDKMTHLLNKKNYKTLQGYNTLHFSKKLKFQSNGWETITKKSNVANHGQIVIHENRQISCYFLVTVQFFTLIVSMIILFLFLWKILLYDIKFSLVSIFIFGLLSEIFVFTRCKLLSKKLLLSIVK